MVNNFLVQSPYKPYNRIDALSKTLDSHSSKYYKIILLGNFNVAFEKQHMNSFCDSYSLKYTIKQPTRYKNPDKMTSVDLTLTNAPKSFQTTCVLNQVCLISIL